MRDDNGIWPHRTGVEVIVKLGPTADVGTVTEDDYPILQIVWGSITVLVMPHSAAESLPLMQCDIDRARDLRDAAARYANHLELRWKRQAAEPQESPGRISNDARTRGEPPRGELGSLAQAVGRSAATNARPVCRIRRDGGGEGVGPATRTDIVSPVNPPDSNPLAPSTTTSPGDDMKTLVPLLSADQVAALPERAREVVEYRKSGLSLNHVQGCPLDCAYCIRHTYGVWDMRQPRSLMTDADAVNALVGHPYFQADVTPIQIFNRATDPMLPRVKQHLFAVLEDLDARGLRNHTLVITRYRMTAADCERLNKLTNVKVTLLFTYSGIEDARIEPYPSAVAANSLRLASALAGRYRTVLYWRPLVPGLNDSPRHLTNAVELSKVAHATVFTGLFYRDEIADYYKANGLPEPYDTTARRKIVPETLEDRVLAAFANGDGGSLFRKTSCAVSYAHELPDYNGHYGIRELCDICPVAQLGRCAEAHRLPDEESVRQIASRVPNTPPFDIVDITDRAIVVAGLDEQPRYHLQHSLGFQVHDARHPHRPRLHGRADIGWADAATKG